MFIATRKCLIKQGYNSQMFDETKLKLDNLVALMDMIFS
jgi:hypothetical protein